jgi:hypothetical protein
MKVRFTADFDWSPSAFNGAVTTAYKAGQTLTVTRECAAAAVAAGKGEIVRSRRGDASEGA